MTTALNNRERFEIALNAVLFANYCLTQEPATIRAHTNEYVDRLISGSTSSALPIAAIAAAKSLGISPTWFEVRAYLEGRPHMEER